MDYCALCFDHPQPIECTVVGTARLDGIEGGRRILGELEIQGPVRLHFVEVTVRQRSCLSGEWVLHAITVCNRSSLPLDLVRITGGTAGFLAGSVRINGQGQPQEGPQAGVEIPGLGPGCEVLLTWQEELPEDGILQEAPVRVSYHYRFGGQTLDGETRI